MATRSRRDPRRSLIIGSVIAALVLGLAAVMVLIGVYLVFAPRSTDRESWRVPPTHVSWAIHPAGRSDS
jgi:hypothetical protein